MNDRAKSVSLAHPRKKHAERFARATREIKVILEVSG